MLIRTCHRAIWRSCRHTVSDHAPRVPPAKPAHRSSSSSASSSRWRTRQTTDPYSRDARVAGLKSRAAYKLLELDRKHRIFRAGDTVIDLGYAPGSWSQVAVNRTQPGGRVVGIDVIPAQPPRGASAIQGDFLSAATREEVRRYVLDPDRGRARRRSTSMGIDASSRGIIDAASHVEIDRRRDGIVTDDQDTLTTRRERDEAAGRVVDVVISDMCAPWPLTTGTWIKSVSNPYFRMLNTTGVAFKDHAGSMDLCMAALTFCYDTLRTGGHFMCKFYQGPEEKTFENSLKALFEKVTREKPASSRKESRENYFVALRRRPDVERSLVFPQPAFEFVEQDDYSDSDDRS